MWNTALSRSRSIEQGRNGQRGVRGTSAKEANGGREWLSAAAMIVDGGVAVGLSIIFMAWFRQKIRWGQNVGCHCARTVSTRLCGKLWEHVVKTAIKKKEIWVQLRRNSKLIMALTSADR